MSWYRWDGGDLILSVQAQPRASRDEVVGPVGDFLKVRVKAPPVDGRANDRLTRILAKYFGVPRSAVDLVHGAGSRRKVFRIKTPPRLPIPLPRT